MSVRDKIHKFEGMEKGKSEEGTSSSSQGILPLLQATALSYHFHL